MSAILDQFGIHWQLLIAQLVNVGLLVVLLRAVAWKPLLAALNARRERIEKSLVDAASAEQYRANIEAELTAERAKLHAEASTIIAHGRDLAEKEAREIIASAEVEATRIRQEAKLLLAEERSALEAEVRGRVIELTIAATSHLLGEEVTPERSARSVDATLAVLAHIPHAR